MAKKPTNRDDELSTRPKIHSKLLEIFRDIDKGFADQAQRSDDIMDYWDSYNCDLSERQFYNGNAKIFVPLIQNAVQARKTRFVNQIFPQSGRYVEVTSSNEDLPHATMALAEHYVRKAKLRTEVVPALLITGDVEGQYTVYCSWKKTKKHVVSRETKPLTVQGLEFPELGDIDTIVREKISDEGPAVEIIADSDFLVLPPTCNSLEECLEDGGSITVRRRWTKGRIRQMIDEGEFEEEAGENLIKAMSKKDSASRNDTPKHLAASAGIMSGQNGKYCMGYETWAKIKVDGEYRITRSYYGGDDQVLGCKLNPYWSDDIPIKSCAVEKQPGVFKGIAPVKAVQDLQILANDMVNMGADTGYFSAMPIVMTDPEKNPRVGTMILGLAAVWETSPKDTEFAQFPPMWEKCMEFVSQCKQAIYEKLNVNPSMIPQQLGGKKKMNQAEIANEQQVDLLTTADSVINIEEGILTPVIKFFVSLDHQYRDDDIVVRQFGDMGLRATMEVVKPIQMNNRYEYRWFGVEAARNAQQIQQQIAMLNVIKGIPPQMYQGHKLNAVPVITQMIENTFGPRIAPLLFTDLKKDLTIDPEIENQLMGQGFPMPIHAMDDDLKHLQSHMQALQLGDQSGNIRTHMMEHQTSMQMKSMQQMQQQGGLPGAPGGQGPGVAGTPQPGGQVQGPRMMKGPPGMIPPESLAKAGAPTMPRKM